MLKAWKVRRDESSEWYERLFLGRHDRIARWALQLTTGRAHLAEDLIQDAYVFLFHSRPDFGPARDIDAYRYGILRNLHRAQLHRSLRQQQMTLSILEFDSAAWGLSVLEHENLIEAENGRRTCHFCCHRKETAKAGSILILRFFHGYYPAEIAADLWQDIKEPPQ